MNHETVGYVALCLSPVGVFGYATLQIKKHGMSLILGRISARFWAMSCAWHAYKIEYKREHAEYIRGLEQREAERERDLRDFETVQA